MQLIALKFNPLDIRDREAEKNVFLSYLEKGVMTINQVAKRLGLAPVAGGDRNFIMTPAGPIFVDELTEASGVEKQALEDEIEGLKMKAATSGGPTPTEPADPQKDEDEIGSVESESDDGDNG